MFFCIDFSFSFCFLGMSDRIGLKNSNIALMQIL